MTEKRSRVQVRIHRSESWLRRAGKITRTSQDKDLDGGFIFYWIAFNALYGQPKYLDQNKQSGKPESEVNDIKRFLEVLLKKDYKRAIEEKRKEIANAWDEILKDDYLDTDCWIAWHKTNLESLSERNQRRSQRRGAGLIDGFLRLYTLRNQLLHGGSTDRGSKNRGSLIRGVEVLGALIPVFVELVRNNSDDKELKQLLDRLPYPPTVGGIG